MSRIGITMGCPVGIGPELILKFFCEKERNPEFTPVVLGDMKVLKRCRDELGTIHKDLVLWKPGHTISPNTIPVFQVSQLAASSLEWGKPNAETGRAMAEYIKSGVSLLQNGHLTAIATCPISKFALQKAGLPFPGHTEMLADLTNSHNFAMMMAGNRLRVTLVTIHCPIADVANIISREEIQRLIHITHHALNVDFSITSPRIAVAGLNPHGGEQGMFGSEEEKLITPAIEEARKSGIEASGPFPPDTIFYQAAKGQFDAVVCMYHDQGLIPFKLLHFSNGVNVTLGLPIVRTSVDHGTAYDIAGKGVADPRSLSAAVELAGKIAKNRYAASQPAQESDNMKNL